MPSKRTLNVSLTEQLSDFVIDQVRTGRFGSASEVVRAALRLLERSLVEPVPGQSRESPHLQESPTPAFPASRNASGRNGKP